MAIEKIIVLGGDLNFRSNLENYLRRCRYDVAPAPTIAIARDYLSRDNFDLIFLDLHLPDGEGTELLKEIQARPQKPLAVITAGTGSVESAVECIKNGAFRLHHPAIFRRTNRRYACARRRSSSDWSESTAY